MDLSYYQSEAARTALKICDTLSYPSLKLAGEVGEFVEKIGKLMRDHDVQSWDQIPEGHRDELILELGDILWYVAWISGKLAGESGLQAVARTNIKKLRVRMAGNTVGGSPDSVERRKE